MKKTISIIFLLIFAFNLIGYYPLFKIVQFQIQEEIEQKMKQMVSDDELVRIHMSENKGLAWIVPGKEFIYKGAMYDVVKQESGKDGITYYCICDYKEYELFANLDEHVQNQLTNNPLQGDRMDNLLKIIVKDYIFQVPAFNLGIEKHKTLVYKKYLRTFSSTYPEVLTPPPKQA